MNIKPFSLGSLNFPHNLIQGPLAGYSCAPFRKLFSEFISPAYCVTEMISAYDLVHSKHLQRRYLWRDPAEKYLCYQLSGNCAKTLSEAVAIVVDSGADLIDLNCGCPKPKIRKRHCGSSLLSQPEHIAELVTAMKKTAKVPVTVKIRLAAQGEDLGNSLLVARFVEQAGADAIIVHGRHWTEDYQTPCRLEKIQSITQSINIPVIGNGDVDNAVTLQRMLNTGCAAVMISRAGTGRPWIFQQLLAELSGHSFSYPELNDVIRLFCQHLSGLSQLEKEGKSLLEARKLLHYYFRDIFDKNQLETFYQLQTVKKVEDWLKLTLG